MTDARTWPRRLARWLLAWGDPRPLAAFRVAFGAALALEAWSNHDRVLYYTPQTFHLPYLPWITPLEVEQLHALFWTQLGLALALVAGLLTRPVAWALVAVTAWPFLICQLNFRNHVYLEILLLILLAASRGGQAWSLDALRRRARPALVPLWPQRLILLQISVVYLYATLHKLSPGFLSGYPLGRALGRALPRSAALGWLLPPQWLEALGQWAADPQWARLLSWLTVGTEGFLAFGLLWRATRPAAIALGLGLHLGIALGMDIYTFGAVMCAAYLCAWTPEVKPLIKTRQ
jgi:uncharacterized membrane protein YphA (DoxX/SURF4 family)